MSNFNKDDFLKRIGEIKKKSKYVEKFKAFNIFNIIPRRFKREEFHSTMLASLLCPKENPTYGKLLLKLFFDTLNENEKKQKLKLKIEDFEDYEICTEKHRIDILIKGKSKNSQHKNVVIIENKINGAPDQPKQIHRYYNTIIKKQETVKAIVYLPLIHKKPSIEKLENKDELEKLLIIFPAYQKDSKTTLIKWLKSAILKIGISEITAILHQYVSYLKVKTKEEIKLIEVGHFHKLLLENDNFKEFQKLKEYEDNDLIKYGISLEKEFPRFLTSKCTDFSELFEIYGDYGMDEQRDSKRKTKRTWYYKFWNPKKTNRAIPEVIRISFNQDEVVIQLWANVKGTGNADVINTFLEDWIKKTSINHQFNNDPIFAKVGCSRKFQLPFKYGEMESFVKNDLVPALMS